MKQKIKTNWAPVLSFVLPGLGQVYQRNLGGGYVFFITYLIFIRMAITGSYGWFFIALFIQILSVISANDTKGIE